MEPYENAERIIGYAPPLEGTEVLVTARTDSDRRGRREFVASCARVFLKWGRR